MIVGFTGTREGPTSVQHDTMKRILSSLPISRFVHGVEAHSDTLAHEIVRRAHRLATIELHPSTLAMSPLTYQAMQGSIPNVEIWEPLPPLDRNRVMVRRIAGLIASPKFFREDSSGTWATIRYAREIGCPVYIITERGEFVRDKPTYDKWAAEL